MTQSQFALSRAVATVATAICLFGATTSGYQGWPGSNTLVDGDAVRFSQQTWRAHLAHPDAVGEYPVRGFDISKEWPDIQKEGAGSIHEVPGWKLAVNVSRSIPASEVQNNGTSLGTAKFPNATAPSAFTGTSISLKGPDAVVQSIFGDDTMAHLTKVEHATTWKVCVTIATDYNSDKKNASGTYNYAGGNGVGCEGLSAQCIAEFEQAYAEHFAATQDCAGHPPPTPASCGGALDPASLRTIQYPLDSVNGTELYVTASEAHAAPRNMSMAPSAMSKTWNNSSSSGDAAAAKLWPVLVVWGWNPRANIVEEEIDGTEMMLKPLAQLSCIKAATAVPNNSNGNGSGSGSGSCSGNGDGNGSGNGNGNGNGSGNGNDNHRPTPTPTATPTTAPESSAAITSVETSTLTGLALFTVALSFILFC